MVKKVRLTPERMKELDGFEEVFDLFEGADIREGTLDPRSGDDTFELYNFLENENKRLHLLDQLYATKLKTLKRHPQSLQLLKEQNKKCESLLNQLIPIVAAHDSAFNEEMERLFNKAYRPAENATESDDSAG